MYNEFTADYRSKSRMPASTPRYTDGAESIVHADYLACALSGEPPVQRRGPSRVSARVGRPRYSAFERLKR